MAALFPSLVCTVPYWYSSRQHDSSRLDHRVADEFLIERAVFVFQMFLQSRFMIDIIYLMIAFWSISVGSPFWFDSILNVCSPIACHEVLAQIAVQSLYALESRQYYAGLESILFSTCRKLKHVLVASDAVARFSSSSLTCRKRGRYTDHHATLTFGEDGQTGQFLGTRLSARQSEIESVTNQMPWHCWESSVHPGSSKSEISRKYSAFPS